jgi:hypothetical protein
MISYTLKEIDKEIFSSLKKLNSSTPINPDKFVNYKNLYPLSKIDSKDWALLCYIRGLELLREEFNNTVDTKIGSDNNIYLKITYIQLTNSLASLKMKASSTIRNRLKKLKEYDLLIAIEHREDSYKGHKYSTYYYRTTDFARGLVSVESIKVL